MGVLESLLNSVQGSRPDLYDSWLTVCYEELVHIGRKSTRGYINHGGAEG